MREIKFRAWDVKNKVMYKHGYIGLNGELSSSFDDKKIDCNASDRLEIMQFTGLTDKNGVDIYEGDIVLVPSGTISKIKNVEIDGEVFTAYKSNPPNKYIVNNYGYAFFLGTKDNGKYAGIINHSSNTKSHEIEVIGNIYEHPHLLDKEDA